MTVYADEDISGAGSTDFGGGQQITFVLIHLTALGPGVALVEESDHILHAGYFALGNDSDAIDATSRTYWLRPRWLDWVNTEWAVEPATPGGGTDFRQWASKIRWWLSPGTEGHLYVFGV